jgi:tetratricopeptide (TPR) repeat protein
MLKCLRSGLSLWLAACALASGCSPDVRLDDIRSLQEGGHFRATIEPLRELLEVDPDDPELNHLYGVALLQTRQPELAIWPLRKAAAHPDHAVRDGLLLAQALQRGGSPEDAIQATSRVLELEPDHVEALRLLVDAKVAARHHREVLEDVERLLALEPDDVGAKVARLVALLNLERVEEADQALAELREAADPEGAESVWGACLERFPADQLVVFGAAEFFNERSQPARGLEILRHAYEAEPTQLQIVKALANRLAASGEDEEAERLLLAATEDGVNDREAWVVLADYYEQRSEPAKARDAMTQALRSLEDPSPAQVGAYVDLLILAGDYDRAEALITELEVVPTISSLLRGRLLLARGEPGAALAALEEGIRLWPDNTVARWLAAQAAERMGNYERALAEYQESVRISQGNWDAVASMLRLLDALGRYREALPVLSRYRRDKPRDPQALVQTIRFASRAGKLDDASQAVRALRELPGQAGVVAAEIAAVESMRSGAAAGIAAIRSANLDLIQPRNAPALEALVEHLTIEGRAGEALLEVDAALAVHPDEALLHELRARALRALGEPAAAKQALERALALEPKRASALAALAALTAERGERDAAIALYDRAYAADPEQPDYAWQAIQLALAAGDEAEAERRLEHLLVHDGTHWASANLMARRLLARDPERALVLARRAVRLRGGADALETLGRIQLERGDAERAARSLGRAAELRPDAPSTQYWLARALSETGDTDGARTALGKALESEEFPEREDARVRLARLNAE